MTFENLLIGGSGKLGSEIALIDKTFYSPKRSELDIENPDSIRMFFSKNKSIRLILNCAAFTDTIGAERNPSECFSVNMVGNHLILLNIGLIIVDLFTYLQIMFLTEKMGFTL